MVSASLPLIIGASCMMSSHSNNISQESREMVYTDDGPPIAGFEPLMIVSLSALNDAVLPWVPTVSYRNGFHYAMLSEGHLPEVAAVIRGPTAESLRC